MSNEELAIRIKAGIDVPENMLQLWEQTKAFIHTIALRYQGYADPEDLEQEGYLALYDAVDGFRPEKGYKFLTYADHWIRQRMKRYIDDCRPVRIPVHERNRMYQYRKMVNAFQVYLGREPTEWEIIYNLELNKQQRRNLASALRMSQIGSLDSTIQDREEGDTLGDLVACDTDLEGEVADRIDQDMLQALIWPMVDRLPDRQLDVIRKRYQENMTRREIGEACGMNMNDIRRAEQSALQGLRRCRDAWKLHAFLPELLEAQAYRHNGVEEFNRTWTSSTEWVALRL